MFGHKFEPRYDKVESGGKWPFTEGSLESQIAATHTGDAEANLIHATREHNSTYVHDVCVRCGETIRRMEE